MSELEEAREIRDAMEINKVDLLRGLRTALDLEEREKYVDNKSTPLFQLQSNLELRNCCRVVFRLSINHTWAQ